MSVFGVYIMSKLRWSAITRVFYFSDGFRYPIADFISTQARLNQVVFIRDGLRGEAWPSLNPETVSTQGNIQTCIYPEQTAHVTFKGYGSLAESTQAFVTYKVTMTIDLEANMVKLSCWLSDETMALGVTDHGCRMSCVIPSTVKETPNA